MTETDFHPVIALSTLAEGDKYVAEIGGRSILLCKDEGRVFALENRCSHAEQPLDCGRVRWGWIACPAHGARFDLKTGAPLNPPATEPVGTFAVRIVDGMIEVASSPK